jgi:hypothetical protein
MAGWEMIRRVVLGILFCALLASCSSGHAGTAPDPSTAPSTTAAPGYPAVPVADLEKDFRVYETNNGITTSEFEPEKALFAIEDFWRDVPVRGVTPGAPNDTILYSWGTKPWGDGTSFQIELIRQVVADGKTWPMTVTMHYEPNVDTSSFGSGTRMLPSQSELQEFGKSVSATDAYQYGHRHEPESVEIRFEPV